MTQCPSRFNLPRHCTSRWPFERAIQKEENAERDIRGAQSGETGHELISRNCNRMIIPRSFFFLFLFPLYRQWRNSRVRMENPETKFPSLRAASVEPEKLESGTFTFDELAGFPLRGRREIRRDKDDPLSRWNFRVVRKGTFNECRTMGTAGVDYPRLDVYLEKRDKRQTCCLGEPTLWKNSRQL